MNEDKFTRYVILLTKKPGKQFTDDLIRRHVNHLKDLDDKGQLELCGPFSDYEGGMIIIKSPSYDSAVNVAESDPYVTSGTETFELRTLQLSCKENNHMGFG